MNAQTVTNVVFAGLGGQGVLKASDILAEVAFRRGHDVKKSEIHGMSQRGGSVTSDVRFGSEVFSPMVPEGETDFLLVLESTQTEPNRHLLKSDGVLIVPEDLLKEGQTLDQLDADESTPLNQRSLNVALLGVLSVYLDFSESEWLDGIFANLPAKLHELNAKVFAAGRAVGQRKKQV